MNRYSQGPWAEQLQEFLAWSSECRVGTESLRIDGRDVPITNDVLRFRASDGYNDTFALQWKRYRQVQLDHLNEFTLTRDRFVKETGWRLESLAGERILEAGSGAGRFTHLMGKAGARLVSFDYSSAVDANIETNGVFGNVAFMQCDIFEMPFADGAFDRVFCHGVLQHTPNPRAAFMQLCRALRPGGAMSIDVYHRDGKIRPWKSKYLWRPLTTRMDPARLLGFLEWFIPKWLPLDTVIKRIPLLGKYLGAVVPCWNYFDRPLSPRQKLQWAILDTFDALAPAYDLPATLDEVREWFEAAGFERVEVREGGNGVVGNGIKRRA